MWLSPKTDTKSRTEFKWLIQKAEVHQQERGEAKQGRKAANKVCVLSKFLLWESLEPGYSHRPWSYPIREGKGNGAFIQMHSISSVRQWLTTTPGDVHPTVLQSATWMNRVAFDGRSTFSNEIKAVLVAERQASICWNGKGQSQEFSLINIKYDGRFMALNCISS